MRSNANRDADAHADTAMSFQAQVLSNDGRLLSEYTLTRHEHNIRTLKAAERCACANLTETYCEPMIIVVSQETLTKFRQVQVKVVAKSD